MKKVTLAVLGIAFIGVSYFSFHAFWSDVESADEKAMVVVIPSYNNEKWCEKNLKTLFSQKYENYRVIYVNDCSSDNTLNIVQRIVKECGQEHRVRIINNEQRRGTLANLYTAIHTCHDQAIIVDYDGDDWFKHDYVLQRINKAYDDPHVWLTYGQYESCPDGGIGLSREIPQWVIDQNAYRRYDWVTSQLRTFYAGLFKRIQKEDLLYKGDFFPCTSDQAFMLPLLEMAGGRVKFISEVLYVYNQMNPINDWKVRVRLQQECFREVRSRRKYSKLNDDKLRVPSQIYRYA